MSPIADNSVQQGADTIATDDLATLNGSPSTGVKIQRTKVTYGDDGTARDVSTAFPLPVVDSDVQTTGNITGLDAASTTTASTVATVTVNRVTGTPTAGSAVALAITGESAFSVDVSGTWTGTLTIERTVDGATWTDIGVFVAGTQQMTKTLTANGAFHGNASAASSVRLRATAAMTGTAAVVIRTGSGTGTITIGNVLRIGDGTSPATAATVKAASTASVSTDTALVVAPHPSSPGPVTLTGAGGITPTAGTISAAGTSTPGTASTTSGTGQVVAGVGTAGNATFHLVTSAFVGTLVFEASVDGGLNYGPLIAIREDGSGSETAAVISTAAYLIRQYTVALPGFVYFRVRASAFTSGTVAVIIAPGPFLIEPTPSLGASAAIIGAVREPHDTGRVQVSLLVDGALAAATEALVAYGGFNGATALTSGTAAFTVPAGRAFRIQSVQLTARGTALDTIRARVRGAATVALASQHYVSVATAIGANAGASSDVEPSREVEIPAGQQVGLSVIGAATTTYTLAVMGYTYVP